MGQKQYLLKKIDGNFACFLFSSDRKCFVFVFFHMETNLSFA